jgi:SnoaL-like domain
MSTTGMAGNSKGDNSQLSDYQQIVAVKYRYGELIDKIVRDPGQEDAEQLADLVTEDAIFEYYELLGRHEGRKNIVHLFTETLPSKNAWMWHSFFNPIVEINGDRAEGRFKLLAMSVRKGGPVAAPSTTYGRYVDQFVRCSDGRWRQCGLQFFNETVKVPAA